MYFLTVSKCKSYKIDILVFMATTKITCFSVFFLTSDS